MTGEHTVRSETPIWAPHFLVPSGEQVCALDALVDAIRSFNRQLTTYVLAYQSIPTKRTRVMNSCGIEPV